MLKIGDAVPSFNLKTESGKSVSSASLKGQRFVLYFYPKDDTPGCTKEACGFRDNLPAFGKLKVPVFGISADDEKAHGKFVTKYQLNFPLLADPEHKTCDAFGTWVEKNMYGRKYFGIQRATFVIAGNGKIEQVWEKVSPEVHAEQVLAYLKGEKIGPSENTVPVKKPAVKKVADKKRVAVKAPAKKAPVKKAVAKKVVSSKPAVKKTAVKKSKA